ncbi:MAG: aminotransferase class V-fold PLP-dependent enzyme [Planctomycetota bacterium]
MIGKSPGSPLLGTDAIYLDHAATAFPRHPRVGAAMQAALDIAGSAGRGGHSGAKAGALVVSSARERLAALFGAADPDTILFFPSSTVALNTAISGLAEQSAGRHVLVGPLEHAAVTRPIARIFRPEGLIRLPATASGVVNLAALENLDTSNCAGVVVQHASNVNGVVQPLMGIGAWCASRGLPFIVDGAQAAGLVPVTLVDIPGLVAYTAAGHKFLGGPPGIGIAYFANEFQPEPLWVGGNAIDSSTNTVAPSGPPRFECGTANLPGIAGLEAALKSFDEESLLERWEAATARRGEWRDRLSDVANIDLIGEEPDGDRPRTAIISLRVLGLKPTDAAKELEARTGAHCRAGLHCAPFAHEYFHTLSEGGTLRIAPGAEVTEFQRDLVLKTLATL